MLSTRKRRSIRQERKIKNRGKTDMKKKTYRRDANWKLIEPNLTGQPGQREIAKDNRKFINVVVCILKIGSLWRDLPPDYGKWSTFNPRFIRWQRKGM